MNHKIPIPPVSRVSWRNGAVLLGAAALVLLAYVLVSRFSVTIDALPELELGGFEEPVRAKLEALRAEIEAHPRSAAAWGKYAMNLYIHDFKTEAIPVYVQAARLDAKDFRWPYLCAIAHTETNSPENMQWYERSLKLNPTYVPLLVRYGHTLATSGDATRAQGLFQKATEADPPSSHAYVELAQIALTDGQDQAARDYLLEAVRVAPYNRRAYEFLAEIYRRTNQPAEAERALAQAQGCQGGPDCRTATLVRWWRRGSVPTGAMYGPIIICAMDNTTGRFASFVWHWRPSRMRKLTIIWVRHCSTWAGLRKPLSSSARPSLSILPIARP